MDIHAAAKVGFPIGDVDGSVDRKVLIFGTSRWVDAETAQHVFRYGVSIRVLVQVSNLAVKGTLTLPMVAAHVETSDAQASAELVIRGYKGPLSKELPKWQSFGVEQYAEYMNSVSDLQSIVMNAADDQIAPQLLATTAVADALPAADETAAIVHAVAAIAHRETLAQARAGQTDSAAEQVAAVYAEAGITDADTPPDSSTSTDARDRMKSWGVDGGVHRRLRLPWPKDRSSTP